jgi:PAS domain S-box-containing protein
METQRSMTGSARPPDDLLRDLAENVPLGMFQSTREGTFLYVNRRLATMLGFESPDELMETVNRASIAEVLYERPDRRPRVVREVCDARGDWKVFEQRFRRRDGSLITTVLTIAERVDPANGETCLYGSVEDVTEQRRAEADLRASERRFATVADFTWDWETWRGPEGAFIYCSPSCERITGYTVQEFLDDPGLLIRITHPDDREAVRAHLEGAGEEGGNGRHLEFRIVARTGETRWIAHECAQVVGPDGEPLGIRGSNRDVTEQHWATRQLRDSEQRHRTLFETMTQGVIYQDARGRITAANPAALQVLGLTLEQLQGRTSMDPEWRAVRPDGSPFPGNEHPAMVALRTGKDVRDVVMGVYNPARGGHTWLAVDSVPQFGPGESAPHQVFTTFTDITARRAAEEALRKSAERLRLINDASLDSVYSYDRDGRFTSANRSLCRALGLTEEQIVGRTHAELGFPDAQCREWDELHRRIYDTGHTVSAPTSTPMPDGRVHSYEVVLNPLHDEHGEIVGIGGATRDITERTLAERALRASERFLDSVVEHSPLAMAVSDDRGTLIRLNQACRDLLGVRDEEVVGTYNILEDSIVTYGGYLPVVRRVFESCETVHFTMTYDTGGLEGVDPDRAVSLVLVVTISPVLDAEGSLTYAVIQLVDVTERKRTEEALRRQSEALAQSNEELERFNRFAVDRELRMVELKRQINELLERLGEAPRYELSFLAEPESQRHRAE